MRGVLARAAMGPWSLVSAAVVGVRAGAVRLEQRDRRALRCLLCKRALRQFVWWCRRAGAHE